MVLGIVRLVGFAVDTAIAIPVVLAATLADRDAKLSYQISQWWAWINVKLCGSDVHVEGLQHLDPSRSYIFMSNHRSNFDVLALITGLWDFQLRWVAKEELAHIPFFGWALRATKHIIVNRSDHAQALASLENAKRQIGAGISAIFFPEGTRSPSRTMLPFKKGGFVFAIETGSPIVPIAVTGTASILPRNGWLVRQGGDVLVAVRPPISTEGLTLEDRDALMAQVRTAIESALDGAKLAPEVQPETNGRLRLVERKPRAPHGAAPSGART